MSQQPVDTTELDRLRAEIQRRATNAEAVYRASKHFIEPGGANLDQILRVLGMALEADAGYIVRVGGENGQLDVTNYWQGAANPSDDPGPVPSAQDLPWAFEQLERDGYILIQDVGGLPKEAPEDLATLKDGAMRRFLAVMFRSPTAEQTGVLAFGASGPGRAWDAEDIKNLFVIGELLAIYWERQRTEESTRKSEERFRLLFEHAPDAYYMNDMSGYFVDGNRAAEEITGYHRDELIGRNMLELEMVPDGELNKVITALSKTVEGQPAEIHGLKLRRKDGSFRIVDIRSYPIKLGDQDLVLGITRDITERVQMTEEKDRLEEQLRQMQKMEAIGQLAGGVAHEINNPLGIILGYAQSIMKRLPRDHEYSVPLQSIEREAQRCRRLVSDLLTFSRKSTGEFEPVGISALLESAASLVKSKARLHNVEIKLDCPDDVPDISGDFTWLQQVLVNLGTNAIDAMPDGGTLKFEARRQDSQVLILVSDNGPGMSRELQQRVFEPFFTTKEVGKGTGLGLSLAYKIIQDHRGEISCQSSVGDGTTFQIVFPIDS